MGTVSFLQQSASDSAGISVIGIGILDMASSRVGTSFLTETNRHHWCRTPVLNHL